MKPVLIIMLFVAIISGCATPYKKAGFKGGYSETRLAENIFQVYFRGNAYTSQESVSDFCLLRAAEITINNGYRYFIIVSSNNMSNTMVLSTATSNTAASAYGYENYAQGSSTTSTLSGAFPISKPMVSNMIVCFKEKPNIHGMVFNAEFVVKSIRGKYELNQ